MKSLPILAFAFVTCLAALLALAADEEPAGIDWIDDLDAARATAVEKGRPLLVVFR